MRSIGFEQVDWETMVARFKTCRVLQGFSGRFLARKRFWDTIFVLPAIKTRLILGPLSFFFGMVIRKEMANE
jgi:hypothetical protein